MVTPATAASVLLARLAWGAPPVAEGTRLDTAQPASPESPFLRAEGPHEAADEGVEYALGATVDYAKRPLQAALARSDGSRTELPAPVETALLLHVGGSLTPARWPELDLSLPIALAESGAIASGSAVETAGARLAAPDAPAIGDLRVGLHYRPVDMRAFGLILGGHYFAPVGSREAYLSDKRFRGEVDLGAAGSAAGLLYGCTFAIAPGFFSDRAGDRLGAACGFHVTATSLLSAGVEPTVSIFRRRDPSGASTIAVLAEPLAALRFHAGGFAAGLGVGPGFGDAPGTAELRALVTLAYTGGGNANAGEPAAHGDDQDLDGVPDPLDACPTQAGPGGSDPATRGCPSLDRDGDGVRDADDFCPDRAGIASTTPKANGCPDSDNDDLADTVDRCPKEPGPPPTGCPRYARLVRDTFQVDPPVAFSDERLTPVSVLALQEIAATVRANPKIELLSVALGTKNGSTALADARARNVIIVFREGNLDSTRYEVVLRDDLQSGTVIVRIVR